MLRKSNLDILKRAINMKYPVFAIQIAKAGTITECMVFAHLDTEDDGRVTLSTYSGEVFDSEDIVLDENPIALFMEYADESEILYNGTMDEIQGVERILNECKLDADDYNALECSENDLCGIIDLLRDGLYIISFAEE